MSGAEVTPAPLRAERWRIVAARKLVLEPAEQRDCAADEVAIRVTLSAISTGTELHAYRDGPSGLMTHPGYLTVGVITAVGSQVTDLRVGDRVFAPMPHASSGIITAARAIRIPEGVPDEESVFAYLGSLGLHCLHEGGYRAGDRVAVIGQGLIGACASLVARHVGAQLTVFEPNAARAAAARAAGFTVGDEDAERGEPADVIVETSGVWPGLLTASRLAGPGTRVAILGVYRSLPQRDVAQSLQESLFTFPSLFHYGHLNLIGCSSFPWSPRSGNEWTVARGLQYLFAAIAEGRLSFASLITHRAAGAELADIMRRIDQGDLGALGVTLRWDA